MNLDKHTVHKTIIDLVTTRIQDKSSHIYSRLDDHDHAFYTKHFEPRIKNTVANVDPTKIITSAITTFIADLTDILSTSIYRYPINKSSTTTKKIYTAV